MEKTITFKPEETLDGCMTFGMTRDGMRVMDFECCEDADVESFSGKCHVFVASNGNVIVTEIPKRVRNKAMFRDDHCTLTLGKDGKYYFVFTISENEKDIPRTLLREAGAIAVKLLREIIFHNS